MLKTTLWVSLFAGCICWAIGAYNRLVRLRAATKESHKAWQNLTLQEQPFSSLADQDIQLAVKIQMSQDAYDAALFCYNHAIKQFPASFVAVLFGFKPFIKNTGAKK